MNVVWLTLAPAQPGQSVVKVNQEVQSCGCAMPIALPMRLARAAAINIAVAKSAVHRRANNNEHVTCRP